MGNSLFKPAPANTIEDYKTNTEFYHSLSDTHYSLIFRDGAYYQKRWQIGFDGTETNVEEMKIHYVLGAGDHARSYLHRTPRGTLIELPLGWYTERGGYWGMSPGFDSRHPQTRRVVSYECIFCHDGYPKVPSANPNPGADPVFTGNLPEGIDCQRCHGPGSQHIQAAQTAGAKLSDISSRIVNPVRLSSKLQMDVCMQCHLEPTTRRLPDRINRFDRGPFSYIPGQPLENFILYFDYPPGTGYDDRFEIQSAAYRLRKSRCFLESKGALTCLSCHDPHHERQTGDEATKLYSRKCRYCHEPVISTLVASGKHPDAADCVSCHMPKRRTDDVVHAVITDHFIQRKLPARDLLAELQERHLTDAEEYRGEVIPYYPSPLPQTSDNNLYLAVAQVVLRNNLQKGVADLAREMRQHPPREMEFYTVLGDAWQNNGNPNAAVRAFEQAVRIRPNSVTALQSLAASSETLGNVLRSEQVLKRALHLAPLDATVWYQYGMLEAHLGRTGSAVETLQKALAINPDLPEGYMALASLFVREAQIDPAETSLKHALSIDPYDSASYDLMGRVLAEKNEMSEALYNFQKATHLRPKYGPYLYDQALALVRAQRLDEAQAQAQAAVDADPNFAESHALLGELLAREQRFREAASEYGQAVKLQPDFSRAHLDLGLVLAAEGDLPDATEHLRKAAAGRDPSVAQQAVQALQRIGNH